MSFEKQRWSDYKWKKSAPQTLAHKLNSLTINVLMMYRKDTTSNIPGHTWYNTSYCALIGGSVMHAHTNQNSVKMEHI